MSRKSFVRKVSGVAVAIAAAVGLSLGVAPAAQALPISGDPISSGCSNGAYTVKSWGVYNSKYGNYQGTLELRYSPSCGMNWVRVTNNVAGNALSGAIATAPNGILMKAQVFGVGSSWSNMVYAPGSQCVTVTAAIQDRATGNIEGRLDTQVVC